MIAPATLSRLRDIKRLELEGERYEPSFDVGIRMFSYSQTDRDRPFQIGIAGTGVEATRNLSLDELRSLREWIDEAIMTAEAVETA